MFKLDNWAGGINNVAQPTRIPQGSARSLVNLDPTVGGELMLRSPWQKMIDAECRGAFALGRRVVFVDGDRLRALDTASDTINELGGGIQPGPVVGAAMGNGQLYLCTPTSQHRTDGHSLKRWDVPAPAFTVTDLPGGSASGTFKVAVTAVGEDGEESGAVPMVISVEGARLQIRSGDTRHLRLYISPANAATLYYQGRLTGGVAVIEKPDDSKARLTTAHLAPMPACEHLAAHHGVLVGAIGRHVFVSEPMMPHLTNMASRFFQFGGNVCALASVEGGVFVALEDRTYFLSAVESEAPAQRQVDAVGAVSGTAINLPDGSAAWFSRYGQVIGAADGSVTYPSRERFAPEIAAHGASGLVEHNGNRLIVTTQRGAARTNNLAAGDFADLEIGNA